MRVQLSIGRHRKPVAVRKKVDTIFFWGGGGVDT
jgi:hypothetical protein